jgi:NAD(P)-dependent dehydrogenase (short-subunit alcohol dehydrogenase family)
MQVRNSTALVTGANRGIGRALVHALLGAGARKVYAAARDLSKLDATIPFDRTRVVPLKLDVTNAPSVEAAARTASDVTLLINNAGVLDFGGILDTPLDKVERNFGTNFYGKLAMARAFAPVIEKNGGGAIVNILTLVALASMPGLAVYNASKAAAWSMTQSLRASLAARNIKVYGVFPGAVDTDMLAGVEMPKTSPEDVARAAIAGVIEGREDIFPDLMSQQMYQSWRLDHKAVEKQFAAM